jgi:type I restriction enzyme S subunit
VNDLVVNIMLAWNGGLAFTKYTGIVSPAYCVFFIINGSDANFLNYLVRCDQYLLYFKAFSAGVIDSRLRLYPDTFFQLSSHVPPIEEQRSIAAFLDRETSKIDALVAEQQRLIDLLREKRRSVISRVVTKGLNVQTEMKRSGVEWIGDVPAHWAVAPVYARYEVQLGKMLDSAKITGRHLRPYLRVADVQWGKINTDDLPTMDFNDEDRARFALSVGDIVVNEGGSYVGRSAIWGGEVDECYYQKALHRLRPRNRATDDPAFFLHVMFFATTYGVFVAGNNQNTIDHLPAEKLRRYRFAFPPLEEQQVIAGRLDAISRYTEILVAEAKHAISLLQERRAALITAAVTGQIDVRHLVGAAAA